MGRVDARDIQMLTPGTKVGPYEVTASLGAGGMGEVFRAHDARLKRDVALKLLPAAAAGDSDRRLRFEREAQVLASLNHPNIAQVFGVERHGDAPVIVMELVEGATLAEHLARAAVPLDEALGIASQIAHGLEAAHHRGVVHRDLKPANIKLLPGAGTVKILDFGLARVLGDAASGTGVDAPTIAPGQTDPGSVLGTAAYMSPEQARGRAVDTRTDIWAFGCIVYEMLTGAPAFAGESTTDVLADVVRRDPDWSRIPTGVPSRIVDVLRRCLEKNPADRWRDVADVRLEMEHGARQSATPLVAAPTAGAVTAPPAWSASRAIAWFAAGAVTAVALLLAIGPLLPDDTSTPVPPATRATITLPPDTTLALARGSAVALSPDGRAMVYAGRSKGKTLLYLRALDRFDAQPLAGTEEAANPFFSLDGRWVAFFADGKLKRVSLDGGAPITVADVINPRGEAWGAGDTIVVTPSNNVGISRVAARGGKLEPLTTLHEGELSHRWPSFLPDGQTMLFAIWNDAGWEPSRIAARRPDRDELTIVVDAGGGYPRYIRDAGTRGFLVYARSEGLLAAPFDESSLAATGQAVPIVDGLITNLSGGAHFDLSPTGTLAYVPGGFGESERDLVWVTRDGKPVSAPRRIRGLTRTWRLSPDGDRVIRNNAGGGGDIWTEDLQSGRATRLTRSPEAGNFNGVWSPDGQSVIFARGMGATDLFRRPSDGRDVEQRLTATKRPKGPFDISPDGKWLLYYDLDPVTGYDLWVLPLPPVGDTSSDTPATEPRPFVKTAATELGAGFSPDGKWVSYQTNESGRFEVFIRSFPDGQHVLRASSDGGIVPVWSPTGDELFYRSLNNMLVSIPTSGGTPLALGKPATLFDVRDYDDRFAISRDGQRLLMMPLIAAEQSASQINVVLNFLSELRQRVR